MHYTCSNLYECGSLNRGATSRWLGSRITDVLSREMALTKDFSKRIERIAA
jgi:hypothetical protein